MGNRITAIANLKKKGADANPNGRPKREWTWTGLIEDQLEKLGPDNKAVKEAVASVLVAKALEGDIVAIKEIGNRVEGMPKQAIEQTGSIDLTYKNLTDDQIDDIIKQKSRKAGVDSVT